MTTLAQRSFSAGEISPALYGRTDQVKWATGLRTCRNLIVQRHGGVAGRPGTEFDAEVKDSTKVVRMIPFIFNTSQTYMLEFGEGYMRVHQNGAQVVEATKSITGITKANPGVFTSVGHGYTTGDEVFISGVVGMTQVNGRSVTVQVLTADTFSVKTKDGSNLDTTSFTAYASGGTVARVYEIVTPYLAVDLSTLKFAESADVITITHPGYPTFELARTGNTSWTLTQASLAPKTAQPDGCTVSLGAGANNYQYRITAVDAVTKEESLPGFESAKTITGATQANPGVITAVGHGYTTGDEVYISGVGGMTQLNGNRYTITKIGADTFSLNDVATGAAINTTGYGAYTSGGTVARTFVAAYSSAAPSTSSPNVITIPGTDGIALYNIYKSVNGVFGFIGSASPIGGATKFSDVGANPDTTDGPPSFVNPFPGANDYPSCVGYFQQRRMFGNTNNNPEDVWGSKVGSFKNFTTSLPIKSDDSVRFAMAGNQVNAVKHLVELGTLIVFTQAGEWSILGDASGALTPSAVNPRLHSWCGSSDLAPIVVDAEALFVQARGNKVRNLAFDWQVNGYRGNDLSIFSTHFFDGYTLVDWTFAKIPNSVVWTVRSDGILIGLTYVREQQVQGWHRHDFSNGFVENVCAIPEGGEDRLYLVIRRTINGRTVRYIERMASALTAQTGNVIDFIGMDSALSFDGRNSDNTKTMTLSGGTNWDYTENLTLTANYSAFLSSDVGNAIFLNGTDASGNSVTMRCKIVGYTSATVVTVNVTNASSSTNAANPSGVPTTMRSVAISNWAKAIKTIGGLYHLEGQKISVLGDGFVAASPNNGQNTVVTVTNAQAQLDQYYSVIHAGLPITCDFENLDVDVGAGETIQDKGKLIGKMTAYVWNSRGVWAGDKPADTAADPLDGLEELKIRGENGESYDDPVALATGIIDVQVQSTWNKNGRTFIRQVDPVPLTILSIMPAGYFPVRG